MKKKIVGIIVIARLGCTVIIFCPPFLKKQQAEVRAKSEKDWIYFACIGGGIILVLILIIVWFILWHRRYDKKLI